jgi:hypothetical protein
MACSIGSLEAQRLLEAAEYQVDGVNVMNEGDLNALLEIVTSAQEVVGPRFAGMDVAAAPPGGGEVSPEKALAILEGGGYRVGGEGIPDQETLELLQEVAFKDRKVDPDEVDTVSRPITIDAYFEKEFGGRAEWRESQRAYVGEGLLHAANKFGGDVFQVRGDGSCGPTAFAAGLMNMFKIPVRGEQLRQRTIALMIQMIASRDGLAPEISEKIERFLDVFSRGDFVGERIDECLFDREFMLDFSHIVRLIGNTFVPNVNQSLERRGVVAPEDKKDFAEAEIPSTPGEEIELSGIEDLAKIFRVKVSAYNFMNSPEEIGRRNARGLVVEEKPYYDWPETEPRQEDFVLFLKTGHFEVLIPDKRTPYMHALGFVTDDIFGPDFLAAYERPALRPEVVGEALEVERAVPVAIERGRPVALREERPGFDRIATAQLAGAGYFATTVLVGCAHPIVSSVAALGLSVFSARRTDVGTRVTDWAGRGFVSIVSGAAKAVGSVCCKRKRR